MSLEKIRTLLQYKTQIGACTEDGFSWESFCDLLRDSRYQFETCTVHTCHFDVVSCGQGLRIMPRGAGPSILDQISFLLEGKIFRGKSREFVSQNSLKVQKASSHRRGLFLGQQGHPVIRNAM